MRELKPIYPISDEVLKFLLCGHSLKDMKTLREQVETAEYMDLKEYRVEYSYGAYYIDNGQIAKHEIDLLKRDITKKSAAFEKK